MGLFEFCFCIHALLVWQGGWFGEGAGVRGWGRLWPRNQAAPAAPPPKQIGCCAALPPPAKPSHQFNFGAPAHGGFAMGLGVGWVCIELGGVWGVSARA